MIHQLAFVHGIPKEDRVDVLTVVRSRDPCDPVQKLVKWRPGNHARSGGINIGTPDTWSFFAKVVFRRRASCRHSREFDDGTLRPALEASG
jgi:hypothetical protein